MCELAKYEALTNRTDQRRRAEREVSTCTNIAELAGIPPAVGVVEALLYAHIQAKLAALLVLLVPKKARALVAHVTQQAPHVMVQATQFSGGMAVTVVCGALLPTGSSANTPPTMAMGLTPYSSPQAATVEAAEAQRSFVREVAPEEPEALDTVTNQCSGVDMKSAKIAGYLHAVAPPFAVLIAPALSQVACAGTEQQTPPRISP